MTKMSFSSSAYKSDVENDVDEESSKQKFVLRKVTKFGLPDMRYKENRDHFLENEKNADGSFDLRKTNNRKKMGFYKD